MSRPVLDFEQRFEQTSTLQSFKAHSHFQKAVDLANIVSERVQLINMSVNQVSQLNFRAN